MKLEGLEVVVLRSPIVRSWLVLLITMIDSPIIVHCCVLRLQQKLLDAEALKAKYMLQPETNSMSSFKKASITGVVPNPDVPPGHNFKSTKYVSLEPDSGDLH